MSNLAHSAREKGNTIPSREKRCTPSKFWCFTLNNWTQEQLEHLKRVFKESKCAWIAGFEVGEKGTPHIQGYVEFTKRVRPSEAIKIPQIHWEMRKGTSVQARDYCIKDGDYIGNMIIPPKAIDPMEGLTPYDWQREIIDMTKEFCKDKRHIYWYWEKNGDKGKTTLAKHIVMTDPCTLYVTGKANDIKCAIADWIKEGKFLKTCIFYYTKSNEHFVSYQALEEVKDGLFFSTKFESRMVCYNTPHIIVFANFPPEKDKMGQNRFIVKNLGGPDLLELSPNSNIVNNNSKSDRYSSHSVSCTEDYVIE